MLSRVANNLYWLARYLERVENTARLINVNSHLLLDLPSKVKLGWEPIIDILSFRDKFYETYKVVDEKSVINFMVVDINNPGAILTSLKSARENARTIKEIIPREAWEQINALYLFVNENQKDAFTRRSRYAYLNKIILANQTITGLLAGTMSHDEAYAFVRLGRNLERADMSTRIIDVRSATLLSEIESELPAFSNIQWMGVLKSMTAYQMYRREVRVRINREDVLAFLLTNPRFPRSLVHAIEQIERAVTELPNSKDTVEKTSRVKSYILNAKPATLKQEKLHEFIDDIQLGLIDIDKQIEESYF
ncbi:alpha-E domain-containing protein [uncultured Paraglaciecola sp.]|uniref:alpha-E domain-containing protein n=1 Tax=uncultured Paraglaciecola sp. TaxID=1765024 RepID=UPI0030D8A95A|tara:strand:+ start:174052 stop:174972 length:921 start_codon:yes stop_codon:yes gene_type:complete